MSTDTMFIMQDGPANALALNKDCSQVTIVGRNIFKVFSIETDYFKEIYNLRFGKNLNLNSNLNDVAWSSFDDTLATAATNGAVVVWNLNKLGKSKQEYVFYDHTRTVNKVNFHTNDPWMLLTGSQDGTMKYYDLRSKELVKTFYSNSESVRDVQFNPHSPNKFAAVSENGNVQLWDIRKPDKFLLTYAAHSEPIFACDWHPEVPWLATASRDKTIKVWDLTVKPPTTEFIIHTIASVSHIKWRPEKKYQLASCALVVDNTINVWDIRRPYIPYATFEEHKDVATGIVWKGDKKCLLSTSRDNTLYQHSFKDALKTISKATKQGISWNIQGNILHSYEIQPIEEIEKTEDTNSTIPEFYLETIRRTSINSENFHVASSVIKEYDNILSGPNYCFYQMAKRYILHGSSLEEMCTHNGEIARRLKKYNIYTLWNIIKMLYGTDVKFNQNEIEITYNNDQQIQNKENLKIANNNNSTNTNNNNNNSNIQLVSNNTKSSINVNHLDNDQYSIKDAYSDDTENDEQDNKVKLVGLTNLTSYQPGAVAPRGDFVFGENELDTEFDRLTSTGARVAHVIGDTQDWILPNESFSLRQDLSDRSPPTGKFSSFSNPIMNSEDIFNTVAVEDQPTSLLTVTSIPKQKIFWNPLDIIVEALKFHAEKNDVQTAVSILIVLGDQRPDYSLIDEVTQEQWISSYIDLLNRNKLWNVSAQVTKLCWLSSINQLNQQSTTIYTSCGRCNKPLQRTGWLCDRCHSTETSLCVVCHQLVKGLFVWCQGCSHGGHLSHIKEWMEESSLCPSGCGHICEYSS